MAWAARVLGTLLIAFGLLGSFAAWMGQGQGFPMPLWNGEPWSGVARGYADWATYAALALGGLALILRQGAALWLFALALVIALARLGYDVAFAEPETARRAVMIQADLIAASAALVALVVAVVARRRGEAPGASSAT